MVQNRFRVKFWLFLGSFPINIFKSFLKMRYIIKKCQIIAKKFENLTLPLWRPIEQGKIRRTIFHCVFYYIVCKSEYILGSLFFRINIFKNLLKMSYILKKWQIISKKFENLTLPLWRPIEQAKIRRTIFQCVFYFIVCKPEYILCSLFFRINIFKSLLKMSYILKK